MYGYATPAHTHDFTYSASGDTITALCLATDCDLTDSKATLKIVAPALTVEGGTESAAATLTGAEDFNAATGKTATATDIKYYAVDVNEIDGHTYKKVGAELTQAPTAAGEYVAGLTLSNVKISDTETDDVRALAWYTIVEPTYAITVNTATHGTVTTDVDEATANTTITITATPDAGYKTDSVTVMQNGESGDYNLTKVAENVYTFDLPAGDVTVSATFEALPATAPTVTVTPTDLQMDYGDTDKTLSVSAETPEGHTLSYQWYSYKNGTKIAGKAIDGATEASYTIPGTTAVGSYNYYCVVTATRNDNGQTATVTSSKVTVTVSKAALTVTAKPNTITYGDAPADNGVEYKGFVNGEDESVLGGTLGYTFSYEQYGDAGSTYTITPSGYTSDNYAFSYVAGKLTVEPKVVGLEWGETSFTYDGNSHAPAATATDLVGKDEIGVTVEGAQTKAGKGYVATATDLTGTEAGNYALPKEATQSFTIAKAPGAAPVAAHMAIADPNNLAISCHSDPFHLVVVEGQEYVLVPKGETPDWSTAQMLDENDMVVYTGLTPATSYEIYSRAAETDNTLPGESTKMLYVTSLTGCGVEGYYSYVGETATVTVEPEDAEGLEYQWYRNDVEEEVIPCLDPETGDPMFDEDGNPETYSIYHDNLSAIKDATSATYTCVAEDEGYCLRCVITKDGQEVGSVDLDEVEWKTITKPEDPDGWDPATLTLDEDSFVYDETEKGPKVTVTWQDYTLTEGEDYTVSGVATATDCDTYELTVTGTGNYKGSRTTSWKIYSDKNSSEQYSGTDDNGRNITGEVNAAPDVPTTQAEMNKEFTDSLVNENDPAGENVNIYLQVENKDPSLVTPTDLAAVNDQLGANSTVGGLFNMELFKKVGDEAAEAQANSPTAVNVTMTVPAEDQNATQAGYTRTFSVLQVVNGVATKMNASYNAATGQITFPVSQFTTDAAEVTYVLVYTDTAKSSSSGGKFLGEPGTTTITVDGQALSAQDYTISNGKVTLTQAYLKTLSSGTHTLKVDDQTTVNTYKFTVTSATTADKGTGVYVALLGLSAMLGAAMVVEKKRKAWA